jgi:transcription elongation factor Elf1
MLSNQKTDSKWECPKCNRLNEVYPYSTRCSRCGYLHEVKEPEIQWFYDPCGKEKDGTLFRRIEKL